MEVGQGRWLQFCDVREWRSVALRNLANLPALRGEGADGCQPFRYQSGRFGPNGNRLCAVGLCIATGC